jgi:hypothetical protein
VFEIDLAMMGDRSDLMEKNTLRALQRGGFREISLLGTSGNVFATTSTLIKTMESDPSREWLLWPILGLKIELACPKLFSVSVVKEDWS